MLARQMGSKIIIVCRRCKEPCWKNKKGERPWKMMRSKKDASMQNEAMNLSNQINLIWLKIKTKEQRKKKMRNWRSQNPLDEEKVHWQNYCFLIPLLQQLSFHHCQRSPLDWPVEIYTWEESRYHLQMHLFLLS